MAGFRDSLALYTEKTKSSLSCCQGISKGVLYCMNGIVLAGGVGLFSVAISNGITQGDLIAAIGQAGIIGSIIAGALLLVVAMIGCIGTATNNKLCLVIYVILGLGLSASFVAVGALFTFTVQDLGNIDGEDSNTLTDNVESQLNDFLIAVFNECCDTGFELDARLLACDDPDANLEACFTFVDFYEDALTRVRNSGLCETLENTEINDIPIVGDPNEVPGACANGNGVVFKAILTQEIENILVPLGAVFLALGALNLITIIASCCLLCANQDQYVKKKESLQVAYAPPVNAYNPPPMQYGNNYQVAGPAYNTPAYGTRF